MHSFDTLEIRNVSCKKGMVFVLLQKKKKENETPVFSGAAGVMQNNIIEYKVLIISKNSFDHFVSTTAVSSPNRNSCSMYGR